MDFLYLGKEQQKEPNGDDDLEAVAGTTEDDFADRVADVREHELLYGSKSLIAVFGPIISQICANNTLYKVNLLCVKDSPYDVSSKFTVVSSGSNFTIGRNCGAVQVDVCQF